MSAWIITLGFFILTWGASLEAQDCGQPYGKWENDNGSILEIIERNEQGQIRGIYRSHEGTEGQGFDVIGWWPEGDTLAVSFSVYWAPYGTLTSWTGMCRDRTMEVLWHHVDPEPRFDFQQWSTQRSVFRPLSAKVDPE